MENRVSFVSDDGPEDDETPRLHIYADDDYYLSVSRGVDHTRLSFRASNSGARDHALTFIIAALWKYGRGEFVSAAECARHFADMADERRKS